MTITKNQIKWGKYKDYEGPYFLGSRKLLLPDNPGNDLKVLDVVTQTEGGAPDAVNMYDSCIMSTGYLQFCEAAYYLTSKLLGNIASYDKDLLKPLEPILTASNAEFTTDHKGRWRFKFRDARGFVDEKIEQKQLFLFNSTGHLKSWDDESKKRAILWAVCMANTLTQREADIKQMQYTAPRLKWFVTKEAKSILWDSSPDKGWVAAMRAGFLSYSTNIPAVAAKHLAIAVHNSNSQKWSKDWCIDIFKELTFGPKIAIYPDRYNKIRPALEKHYGIDLPDFATELKNWTNDLNDGIDSPIENEPDFTETRQIQQFLLDMGYDLGPSGADGIEGPKTKDAILTFQQLNGLTSDGIVNSETRKLMLEAYRQKVCT
jgi:hypothetical protein